MKKINNSILISILLIAFYSCSDGPVSSNFNYDLVSFISGEVLGLPDDAQILKAIVELDWSYYTMDSSIAGPNNAMQFYLSPAEPEFLCNITDFIYSDPTVMISDINAKVNVLSTYAFDKYSDDYAGDLIKDNSMMHEPYSPGYFCVFYLYSDRSVRIEGFIADIYEDEKVFSFYNINLARGWNVLTLRYIESGKTYPDTELFNGECQCADWSFRYSDTPTLPKAKNLFRIKGD